MCCSDNSKTSLPCASPLPKASIQEDASLTPQQFSVCKAFAGRTVLLTGVTGLVGSLVLEQLLRTCPDISKIYVIVRQKHGITGLDRVQQMLHTSPLFHLLRSPGTVRYHSSDGTDSLQAEPAYAKNKLESVHCEFTCVEAIAGDMTLPGYGIAQADMQRLQQQTDIVIHAAASISFDDHIHDAISHNYMVGCTRCSPTPQRLSACTLFVHNSHQLSLALHVCCQCPCAVDIDTSLD